jgi:hypothetical protein
VFGFLTKLITAITFQKVLLWSLAGILVVVGYTAYEHRTELFQDATRGRGASAEIGNPIGSTFVIGETTKGKIQDFVKTDKDIVGLTVISVDIRLNVRNQIYFYSDPSDPSPVTLAPLSAINRLPLFTKNDDNNRQMIKLINGEFTCTPYTQTMLGTIAPGVNKDVITVCRASLPPYYGHFSGYVSILLNNDPDIDEQVRLKTSLELLATEIYFRDVIPTTRRVQI